MNPGTTPLERAFEIARSGRCLNVADVRRVLKSEGYSDIDVTGRTLSGQLRKLIVEARAVKSV